MICSSELNKALHIRQTLARVKGGSWGVGGGNSARAGLSARGTLIKCLPPLVGATGAAGSTVAELDVKVDADANLLLAAFAKADLGLLDGGG